MDSMASRGEGCSDEEELPALMDSMASRGEGCSDEEELPALILHGQHGLKRGGV